MLQDLERRVVELLVERHLADGSGGRDSGDGADAGQQAFDGRGPVLRQHQLGRDDAIGAETGRGAESAQDALHQERGADQETDGERGLGDHQDAAEALALGEAADGGGEERGNEAEEERGQERHTGGEGGDARVEADLGEARKVRRAVGAQQIDTPEGDPDGGRAGEGREQQVLGEELAEDPAAAGADGGSDGELALAGAVAGEEEVGDVHAGDQDDEADRAEEDPQHRPDAADDPVLHGHEVQAPALVGVRELGAEAGGDVVEVALARRRG